MKKNLYFFLFFIFICIGIAFYKCHATSDIKLNGHKTVICIPVYGQSLALGEEAIRITDFDTLRNKYDGRILTECLDYDFGYIDDSLYKQRIKKFLHYRKRSYELSIYGMAEYLVSQLGEDTVVCIFPGGKGMSPIDSINKPNNVYRKFLFEIEHAYNKSKERGWVFYVPAICWMQGESDIIDYTKYDYKNKLKQFCKDINKDIKDITNQTIDIHLICYQSNAISKAENFDQYDYNCIETKTPMAIVNLLKEDSLFWASGPTYPYSFVNESLHIDGISQKLIGNLHALSALDIIRGNKKRYGLIPLQAVTIGNDISIKLNVPCPPLVFDTTTVNKVRHMGFCVINHLGKDILNDIFINGDNVILRCSESPQGCKARYAINGEKMKSGNKNGPRGNLRDSQGEKKRVMISKETYPLHNWCYQFDIQIE